MILFYGEGRFGNQVFQYQALCRIAKPKEHIFAVGLEELQHVLELHGPMLTVLTRNRLMKQFVKYVLLPVFLRPLARVFRLVNYVSETEHRATVHQGPAGGFSIRRGLARRLTLVDGGYYQNPALWTSVFPTAMMRVRVALREAARNRLDVLCGKNSRATFVHVRRGDYLAYKSYGLVDFSLPMDYYRTAIRELENRIGRSPLVFVTDDAQWVDDAFSDIADKAIVSSNAPMDFAIMAACGSGILSNSTFALAAAFMLDEPDLVVAPRFWFGFRVQLWLPPLIELKHDRILYVAALPQGSRL